MCEQSIIHRRVEGRKFGPFLTSHTKINIDHRLKEKKKIMIVLESNGKYSVTSELGNI